MSNSYYQDLWKAAQEDLRKNIAYDQEVRKKGAQKDPEQAKWLIGHLFMGYVKIVNKLDQCYDQIIHPQKREVIGRLLDTCLGRLLEIKRDIVKIELDDYVFFDNILIELKMTPDEMEIRVPQYFWREKEKVRINRRKLIEKVNEDLKREEFKMEYLKNIPDDEKEEKWVRYLEEQEAAERERLKQEELQKKRMGASTEQSSPTSDKAEKTAKEITNVILLIQRHERARQARMRIPDCIMERKIRKTGIKHPKVPEDIAEEAAIVIQKHWRRHRRRILQQRRLEKQMLILGLIIPSWRDLSDFQQIQEVLKYRRAIQEKNQEEYENAVITIKEKITNLYSESMYEDTIDEIRYWFEWFFQKTDFLPDYPGKELVVPTGEILGIPKKIDKEFIEKAFPQKKKKGPEQPMPKTKLGLALTGLEPIGGSALVTAEHWIGPKEFLVCQKELERLKKSGGGKETKQMTKEEKAALKKKEKEEEKRRLLAAEAEGFRMAESDFIMPLIKADKDYRDYWMDLDESNNYDQRYIHDLVQNEKCWELSMEIRKVVDDAMRLELDVLKDALERDKNPKKKKPKKPKPPKKEKGKKGKPDPTGDKTSDELFEELFRNGIIREYEEAYLKDFIGERSFSSFELRRKLEDGNPCLGDVRELILQLCILPLGSNRIHQLSPAIRSVCLLGPEHNGKEFLARIVCTETAAVMFDLTPENTAGKYPGKDGMKMLQHLIEKMSRILQPTVIFIDGAEKLFYKKVPKEEKQYEPKRLGGMLTKIIKGIKPGDQVLVLGTSNYPWLCPKPKLTKNYDKFIFVPEPDYGTYYMLWQKLLTPYHSIPRDFDYSCLAKVSKRYSIKVIIDLVQQILTPDRIARSRVTPYKPAEFIDKLCRIDPMSDKIVEKCIAFYDKTDMRKKRLDKLQELKNAAEKGKMK